MVSILRVKALRTGVIHHALRAARQGNVGRDESRPYERSSSISTLFHSEGRRPGFFTR